MQLGRSLVLGDFAGLGDLHARADAFAGGQGGDQGQRGGTAAEEEGHHGGTIKTNERRPAWVGQRTAFMTWRRQGLRASLTWAGPPGAVPPAWPLRVPAACRPF